MLLEVFVWCDVECFVEYCCECVGVVVVVFECEFEDWCVGGEVW